MAMLRVFLRRVSPDDVEYALHGLRVEGYNQSKRGNGEDITVAHGGWHSEAHRRYERFSMRAVLAIPANMVSEPDPYAPREPLVRAVTTSDVPLTRGEPSSLALPPPPSDSPGHDSDGEDGGALPMAVVPGGAVVPVVAPAVTPAVTRSRART